MEGRGDNVSNIISVVICEDTLLTTRGIFLDKMINKGILTYKVCKVCDGVYSNKRKNGKLLGPRQTNSTEFCGRKCAGKFRKIYSVVYCDNGYCYFLIGNKQFKFSTRHLEKVIKHSWYEGVLGYAESRINGKIVRLHSLILGVDKLLKVDHINRDKTDNRDENLRMVTHAVNIQNSKIVERSMRGISKNKDKYSVSITKNGVRYRKYGLTNQHEAVEYRDKLLYDLYGKH